MKPNMRRHLPGRFLPREIKEGAWRLSRSGAEPIDVFLQGADPRTAEVLRRNLANQRRATVIEAGIGAESGRASMTGDGAAIGRRVEAGGAGDVELLTVPDVLERAGVAGDAAIDVLKCDVEGAERALFAHCAPWIGRVRTLAVETHDGYTVADVSAATAAAGAPLEVREHVVHAEFGNEVGVLVRPEGAG